VEPMQILRRSLRRFARPGTMGSAPMGIRFRDIMKQAPQMRAAQAALEAEFGAYERLRPRDPMKARGLCKMGTADNLVGPDALSEAESLGTRARRSS
jgi:hypothetical protein